MSAPIHTVLKLNRIGKGYIQTWLGEHELLDQVAVDRMLPSVDECPSSPCVSYSVTRLNRDQVMAFIGCFWPQYHDEYGRDGLFFWHGIVIDANEGDPRQFLQAAGYFLGLIQKYQADHEEIGNIVSRIAVENLTDEDWNDATSRLAAIIPSGVRPSEERAIRAFQSNVHDVPVQSNLRVPQDGGWRLSAVLLLTLALAKRESVTSAGGALSRRDVGRFTYIATDQVMPMYASTDVSSLLLEKSTPEITEESEIEPALDPGNAADASTQRVTSFPLSFKVLCFIATGIVVAIAIVIVPGILWPDCTANIIDPGSGEIVSGNTRIRGSANDSCGNGVLLYIFIRWSEQDRIWLQSADTTTNSVTLTSAQKSQDFEWDSTVFIDSKEPVGDDFSILIVSIENDSEVAKDIESLINQGVALNAGELEVPGMKELNRVTVSRR